MRNSRVNLVTCERSLADWEPRDVVSSLFCGLVAAFPGSAAPPADSPEPHPNNRPHRPAAMRMVHAHTRPVAAASGVQTLPRGASTPIKGLAGADRTWTGMQCFSRPAAVGATVNISYFGPPPSDSNRVLLDRFNYSGPNCDATNGTVTIPLYRGTMKNGAPVWYILTMSTMRLSLPPSD